MKSSRKAIKLVARISNTTFDSGKIKLGGQSPIFRKPVDISDNGKVRLGGQGPIFR